MDHPHAERDNVRASGPGRRRRRWPALLVALLLGLVGIGALFANPIITVQLQASDAPIREGNSGATRVVNFTVSLSQALGPGQEIVLELTTADVPSNSATAGVDYSATPATLTFGPGDTLRSFPVTIIGDNEDELNEAFLVRARVVSATGAPAVQPPVGSFTETLAVIIDDDNPTVQSISAPSAREGPGATLDFVVTLSAVPLENVVIGYATANGSAIAGADFVGVSNGILVIPEGQQTGVIRISVLEDGISEPPETMTLNLNPATSFSVNTPFLQSSAIGTIRDAKVPPVMDDQRFTVAENSPAGTAVGTIVVSDEEPASLNFTVTGGNGQTLFDVGASSGAITVATGAVLDYEAQASYTLEVEVCDLISQCDTATITIELLDRNEQPPVVTPGQSFSVAENSPVGTSVGSIAVTDADGPTTGRSFRVTGGSGQALFSVVATSGAIRVAGALDYEAQPSYTLEVEVCDGGTPNLCGTGTVTINLTNVNEAPAVDLNGPAAGVNYSATYSEQDPLTLIVAATATVTDPDGDQIASLVATITDPRNGAAESLSVDTSGVGGVSAAYNPTTGALTVTGPASVADMTTVLRSLRYANTTENPGTARRIEVVASDTGSPALSSPVATIELTIVAVDDPPELVNNGLVVAEGQRAAIAAAVLRAIDPDTLPAALRFTVTALPTRGALSVGDVSLVAGGSFTQADIDAGRVAYTHDGSETTSDSFRFTLRDETTTLPEAQFTITITAENDDPVITTSSGATFYLQGQPAVLIDPAATVSDADSPNFNGGSLTVALSGGAPEDQLAIQDQGTAPGAIGRSGTNVSYGGVVIGSVSGGNGSALVVTLNANATREAVQALVRAVTFANTATVTTSGPRTASFIVSDGAGGNSAPATKLIDINLLPIAKTDRLRADLNSPNWLRVLANDVDPDGDPLTVTAVTQPEHGTVTIISNGTAVRYTPEDDYLGPDRFNYTISDGRGGTASAEVTLTVEQVRIVLPLVKDRDAEPDLVVSFELVPAVPRAFRPATINVTVTNRGRAPASSFWVDFYINPREEPTVNLPWNENCGRTPCEGIAWFYEGSLGVGERVTFNSRPQSSSNPYGYQPRFTVWNGLFQNGPHRLYAYVDSWNRDSSGGIRDPRGAVSEENERNNRAEQRLTIEDGP